MTRHHRNLALHHLTVLAVLSTTVLPGASAIEDLDPGDVPAECALACAPIAQLTERCEAAAEQKFGAEAVSRRWTVGKQRRANAVDGGNGGLGQDTWQRRRQKGTTRSLQRMLGSRLDRRQEELAGEEAGEASEESSDDSDDSDDSDSSDSEEEEEEEEKEKEKEKEDRLASGNATETGGGEEAAAAVEANQEAAVEAMRACVCGETGFDVAGAAFGCAACVAQNATAKDANEDIRQIMANCGFIAATDPVTIATTTFPNAMSTLPPLLLAPAASGTETSPPPSPASPTSTSFPPATMTRAPDLESITPVTVFVPPFSTLPPLVLPNDVPSAPPVLEQNLNQLSGAAKELGTAFRGWLGPGWLVLAVVIGLLLS
ncbi:hypothetical protein LZ31DRAFT_81204 [Colletotrichum somersetense]|nr:hypothetical protein LZ31DRAFT_81204 [Colletotrichum somersetense]